MAATCQTLLDDLNDRLNDAGNSFATQPVKIGWLNQGLRAMFPRVYRTARDSTITITSAWEYPIPAAVGNNSRIIRIEQESASASNRYVDLFDADVVPDLTSPILVFRGGSLPPTGAKVRITSALPLTEFSVVGDAYSGPLGTEELPVLYAMGIALSRRLEDRVDHRRYSTTAGQNQVDTADIMDASQFWFGQFELLLERKALPLPAQQG